MPPQPTQTPLPHPDDGARSMFVQRPSSSPNNPAPATAQPQTTSPITSPTQEAEQSNSSQVS